MAEQHQLLAAIERADAVAAEVVDAQPRACGIQREVEAVQRLVRDLGGRLQQHADDVVRIGDAHGEAARRQGHRLEQRRVGAVAHDGGEEAHVLGLGQLEEVADLCVADIGDAVGDEDHRAGAIGIERVEAHLQACIEVGAAFRRDVADPFDGLATVSCVTGAKPLVSSAAWLLK